MTKFFPPIEYVTAMQTLLKLKLSDIGIADYCEAVVIVQNAKQDPLDVVELHRTLMATDIQAGEYRQSAVRTMRGLSFVERDLPRYTEIEKLMFSFRSAYRNVLAGAVPQEILNYEYLAWSVAAGGRCLHPFCNGNTALFMLVENHIRQVHGLTWRVVMRPKEEFDKFRKAYKRHYSEHYGEKADIQAP